MFARSGALALAHECSSTYLYIVPNGHTLEACQRPDYWKDNVLPLSRARYVGQNPWHKIELIADDGTWEAMLRVVGVSDGLVTVRVIYERSYADKTATPLKLPDGYKVEHIPTKGWRALDRHSSIITAGAALERDAIRAAVQHARKVAS